MSNLNLSLQMKDLNEKLKHNSILLKENILPVSLSPVFISLKEYNDLAFSCEHILSAIELLLRVYCENPQLQELFPELANSQSLSLIQPVYDPWIFLARFDLGMDSDNNFKLLETNCDCPGAVIFTGLIKQCYQQIGIYDAQVKPYKIVKTAMDDPTFFIKGLVNLYQRTLNTDKLPSVAFLTSHYRPLVMEIDLLVKISKEMGLPSQHIFAETLNSICNSPSNNNGIDLVYQKCDSFVDSENQVHYCIYEKSSKEIDNYLKLIKEHKLLAVNSFPAIFVAENKRILALLQHPDFQSYFSEEQKLAIKKLCPRTFALTNKTPSDQSNINEVLCNKDNYVLKRVIDTQGRGVTLGCECSIDDWHTLINQAINSPFIIQEFVGQRPKLVYSVEQSPKLRNMNQTLSLFLLQGKASGLIMRSSPNLITNINQTGVFQNVFIKE